MRFRVVFNDPLLTKIAIKSLIAKTQSIYNLLKDVLGDEAWRYSLDQVIKQVFLDVAEVEELIGREFDNVKSRFENGIYKIRASNDIGTRYFNVEISSVVVSRTRFNSMYIYIYVDHEDLDRGHKTSYEFGIQVDSEIKFPIVYMDRLASSLTKFVIAKVMKENEVTRKELKKVIAKTMKRMYKQYARESYEMIYGNYELAKQESVLRKVKHVI